ncbi:nonribosomal peptide synthetase [Burkholderia gladioli]|nr:nonribosomal peptide synthetase [Burkholderia gladioli]
MARRGGRRSAARRDRAGRRPPGLRHLHLGLDRHAEGRDDRAPRAGQPCHGDHRQLRGAGGQPRAAVRLYQLRCEHLRGSHGAVPWRRAVRAGRRDPPRPPGAVGLSRTRGDHARDPAAGAAAGRRGLAADRHAPDPGPGGRGARRGAVSRAGRAGRAAQRLRADRGHRVRHRLALPARLRRQDRADRAPDRQRAALSARRAWPAGTGRHAGRDSHRRGGRGSRLPEPARAERRAFPARSVQRDAARAHVSQRRPGALPARRQPGVPRPQRRPGQDSRLPDRARRDRGPAGRSRGGARGGRDRARGRGGRPAPGGLLHRG